MTSNPIRIAGAICVCLTGLYFWEATVACSAKAADVVLVKDGASDWHVSLRPEPSSPERLAARELAKYVQEMSGAKLEVVEETVASEKAIRIDCDDGVLDGFDLTVTPDGISIHGHAPRGALYGAYQILESMGCRWYYIGELGEVVPACGHLSLSAGKSSETASFRERSVMLAYPSYYERFDQWIDFLTKSRINNIVIYGRSMKWWQENRAKYLPLLKQRQTILEFGGHILPIFVPRALFAEHPDYFRSLGLPVYQNLMVCFRDWHSPPFSMVVFVRAAWNADTDGQEVLEDFCRHYYGDEFHGPAPASPCSDRECRRCTH